ncbi:MAG TPA: substrate-binding domain-containing protein [Acetobacteraceae bacterium]|nr:substrate-binding domain-containing protein [Acetobacteraceae bacterium]
MIPGRRGLLQAALFAAPAIAAQSLGQPLIAPAHADTTDLVLLCDKTLGPACVLAGAAYTARTGVRIRVFPTTPSLLLPQLARDVQSDILMTRVTALDQAARDGLLLASDRAGPWRTGLVLAGREPVAASAAMDRVAVPDPTSASDIDGPTLLDRLGLHAQSVQGVLDTESVTILLISGAATAGVLHGTDVKANPRLGVIRTIPDAVAPPLVYAAAITRGTSRPNPQRFLNFLKSPDATSILAAAGLESAT